MIFLLVVLLVSQGETAFQNNIIFTGSRECLLVQSSPRPADLGDLLDAVLERGCRSVRISEGEWRIANGAILADLKGPLEIRGNVPSAPPLIMGVLSLQRVDGLEIKDVVVDGTLELDQTENVIIHSVWFRNGGIVFKGRRCNQPNECVSYNRNIRVENSIFENCLRGIAAERLESSLIAGNRFTGKPLPSSCGKETVGIELDGSGEDVDRPLEQGHNKGNLMIQNVFDQEFAIGIRIKESLGNTIRDNQFRRSYRALEIQTGAKHNQIISNYIGYLSQQPASSACPGPCGIYAGPGSINNIFLNNFFEQNVELQFLQNNRNRTFVIDESGNANTFRSDFQSIR